MPRKKQVSFSDEVFCDGKTTHTVKSNGQNSEIMGLTG